MKILLLTLLLIAGCSKPEPEATQQLKYVFLDKTALGKCAIYYKGDTERENYIQITSVGSDGYYIQRFLKVADVDGVDRLFMSTGHYADYIDSDLLISCKEVKRQLLKDKRGYTYYRL
jgi:hypothetical protein